jgi:hypothetical protein
LGSLLVLSCDVLYWRLLLSFGSDSIYNSLFGLLSSFMLGSKFLCSFGSRSGVSRGSDVGSLSSDFSDGLRGDLVSDSGGGRCSASRDWVNRACRNNTNVGDRFKTGSMKLV